MRKLFIFTAVLLFTNMAMAQEPMSYSRTISAKGLHAATLHDIVQAWLSDTLKSPSFELTTIGYNQDTGILMASGTRFYQFPNNSCYDGSLGYTLEIELKEGEYKGTLSNINHKLRTTTLGAHCIYASGLGLIKTGGTHTDKGMFKMIINGVADNIKAQMQVYAEEIFTELKKATDRVVEQKK